MSIEQRKSIYVVMNNNGETSVDYPKSVTEHLRTAKRLGAGRYIDGNDCPIKKMEMVMMDGTWYVPVEAVKVISPSSNDLREQREIDNNRKLLDRLIGLGVTSEEIQQIKKMEMV